MVVARWHAAIVGVRLSVRTCFERTLRALLMVANVFEVEMHHNAENNGVVLTERTDILRGPLLDTEFWVCGTFVIRDGLIAVWRDRSDVGQVTGQILTSPLRKLARSVVLLGHTPRPMSSDR